MKILVWVVLITMLILPAGIFVQQLSTSGNFESNAVAILQREGGVTNKALTQINKLSKNLYHGMYEIKPVDNDTAQHPFGERIDYKIIMKYHLNLFGSDKAIYTTSKTEYTTSQIAVADK